MVNTNSIPKIKEKQEEIYYEPFIIDSPENRSYLTSEDFKGYFEKERKILYLSSQRAFL